MRVSIRRPRRRFCSGSPPDTVRLNKMPAAIEKRRAFAANCAQHKRTPEIVARLHLGFCLFVNFARSVGAVSEQGASNLKDRSWEALGEAAAAQGRSQKAADPVLRFLELTKNRP